MKVINKYISVSDKAVNEAGEIYIYGDICDEKWFDEDVTPKEIRDSLNALGNLKSVDIHLNSYGGSCIAGNAIINILDSYRRKNNATINVYIEGIAASMGSGIASVGDKVYMAENSLYMVHLPSTIAMGNKDDLEKTITILEKTEETLLSNYMRRFKGTEDELKQMMQDETWLDANEALEYGFADEVISGVKVAASAKGIRIGNQVFENKVADMIKNKYPNINLEKEEHGLTYDEKLGEYGITQDVFDTMNLESDKVMEIVNHIKDAVKPEPVEQFVNKENALAELGVEDITAEEVLNYAKAGMHPVDTTEIEKKAKDYDKIVSDAKASALTNAFKAQGDSYNESRMKKYLDVLTYDEIVEQDKAWQDEAKKSLNAGRRVSQAQSVHNDGNEKSNDIKDYEIFNN